MTLEVRRSPSDHGSAWPTSRLTGVGKAENDGPKSPVRSTRLKKPVYCWKSVPRSPKVSISEVRSASIWAASMYWPCEATLASIASTGLDGRNRGTRNTIVTPIQTTRT